MGKHHVKGKKKKSGKKDSEAKKQEELLKNLDRFAGSSEEEDNDRDEVENEYDDNSEDEINESNLQKHVAGGDEADESSVDEDEETVSSSDDDEYGPVTTKAVSKKKKAPVDSDEDKSDEDDSDDENMFPEASQNGMAGAMARILGVPMPKAKDTKAVVLSKTITPLQKQQKKEKEEYDALRLKRKQRREIALTALHVPLSAATSRPIVGKDKSSDMIAKAMAQEIEVESMHRRVATRGVVALFNTISQHQQQRAQEQADAGLNTKKSSEIKTMSKHGFLDMLKKTGSSKIESSKDTSISAQKVDSVSEKKASKGGWNALKDDFLMNKKITDWDKALSEDEDESEDEDDISRMKRAADVDDMMDDDSSEDEKPKRRKLKA